MKKGVMVPLLYLQDSRIARHDCQLLIKTLADAD